MNGDIFVYVVVRADFDICRLCILHVFEGCCYMYGHLPIYSLGSCSVDGESDDIKCIITCYADENTWTA